MSNAPFQDLGSALEDARFPDVDMALRRGRHVDREDADWYAYMLDAQVLLEDFYRRFGCELVHRADGYFFLLPTGEKLGRRQLSVPEMLVGQGVALLYLDPRTVESGGVVTREMVLSHLAAVMGVDALVHAFSASKRRRLDERVAQEAVRNRVAEALRKLAGLGFVELMEGDRIRLRCSLMRFAEPVRSADSPADALSKLVARGEVALSADTASDADEPSELDAADDGEESDEEESDEESDEEESDEEESDEEESDEEESDEEESDEESDDEEESDDDEDSNGDELSAVDASGDEEPIEAEESEAAQAERVAANPAKPDASQAVAKENNSEDVEMEFDAWELDPDFPPLDDDGEVPR